jgi:hypothetical protein
MIRSSVIGAAHGSDKCAPGSADRNRAGSSGDERRASRQHPHVVDVDRAFGAQHDARTRHVQRYVSIDGQR